MNRLEEYENILNNTEYKSLVEHALTYPADTKLYLYTFVPAMTEFVKWVVGDAVSKGKKKLFFLARDGYQMYLIADAFVKNNDLPISCRYLQVSRHSMRLPGYHLDIDRAINQICIGGIDVSVKKILARGGLSKKEIDEVLSVLGMIDKADDILNYSQIMELRPAFHGCDILKKMITEHSKAAYENAVGYLKQEAVDRDSAIVDSGWIGTLQMSIEMLLKIIDPAIFLEGYYFGMYEYPPMSESTKFHPFYFSPKSGLFNKVRFSNSLFETIVSEERGMTLGYEYDEDCGRYTAVLGEGSNPNREQLKRNISALEEWLSKYSLSKSLADCDIKKLFTLFMSEPTELEVDSYGNNPFSDDVLDKNRLCVAADLTKKQITDQRFINKLLIVLGIKKGEIYESAWIEGSVVRLGETLRERKKDWRHIRMYKMFVYARKQLKK